jgi:hypothetical protein
MRIRSIKPEFFEDEDLAQLPPHARLLFIGTWMMADRNGVLENRPKLLQVRIFPYESGKPSDVSQMIPLLIDGGYLVPFEVEGRGYLWIPTFTRHQRITGKEHDSGTRYPLPPDDIQTGKHPGNTRETPGCVTDVQERGKGKGKEGSAEQVETLPYGSGFAAAWEAWLRYRREIRKPLGPSAVKSQLRTLAGFADESRAVEMIEHTIFMGWQGLREKEAPRTGRGSDPAPQYPRG